RNPVFDVLQPTRRRVDRLAVVAEEEGEVLQLRIESGAALEIRRHARVERREVANSLPDGRERVEHRAVLLVKELIRLGAGREQALGVREARAFRRERLILARLRRRSPDLVALERQQIDARELLAFVEPQRIELRTERAEPLERLRDTRARRPEARVRV